MYAPYLHLMSLRRPQGQGAQCQAAQLSFRESDVTGWEPVNKWELGTIVCNPDDEMLISFITFIPYAFRNKIAYKPEQWP